VDAQLPPHLARWLIERGHEAEHVGDIGMLSASDQGIWRYALERGAVLVTKDEDFAVMSSSDPSGPSVVWLRLGNVTRGVLLSKFPVLFPEIERRLTAGEKLIEVTEPSILA